MPSFKEACFGTTALKIKNITLIVITAVLSVIIILHIVKLVNASVPLFASVYLETSSPKETFPVIAICPGRNATQIAKIDSVLCAFYHNASGYKELTTNPADVIIDNIQYNCMVINRDEKVVATSVEDIIRCTVWTDLNVIVSFFDDKVALPANWFGWNVLNWGDDTALGIVKWYYQGKVFGYQVDVEQDEYRFNENQPGWGLAFSVQWDFLGQATERQFYTYDLGTAIGVIGGYVFLALQLYKFNIWLCSKTLNVDMESTSAYHRMPEPVDPKAYGTL